MLSPSRIAQQKLASIAVVALAATATAQVCPTATVEAEVGSSSPVGDGGYGTRLSYSGDTLAVSAPFEDVGTMPRAGAVHVMTRIGSTWVEEALLASQSPASDDLFGLGVALDGDRLAIGAPFADASGVDTGRVTLWVRSLGVWSVEQVLEASGPNGALFGWDVALDGDVLAVGAPGENGPAGPDTGAVYAYQRVGGTWVLDEVLTASDRQSQDYFGYSVGLSATTVIAGAYGHGLFNEGAAYVYRRTALGWNEQAKLQESPPSLFRLFGIEVDIEGDQAVVAAPSSDLSLPQPGSVYVYLRAGVIWTETAELTASNGQVLDDFGSALDLSGTRLAVAAQDNDSAYVFTFSGGWAERLMVTAGEVGADQIGPVAVDGDSLLVGAPFDTSSSFAAAGEVSAVRYTNAINPSLAYCTSGTSASGCQAVLTACGVPSATASGGFALQATSVEGAKDGLFFFGTTGRQANPWGSGTSFQCVVPPVFRGGTLAGTGTLGACDGVTKQDLNGLWCPVGCPRPLKNPGAGALVQAQFWYRDPFNTSNQTTSLSGAIEFTGGP